MASARKYAEIAPIRISEIPKLRAICAEATEAKTEAHPFAVQAYAR